MVSTLTPFANSVYPRRISNCQASMAKCVTGLRCLRPQRAAGDVHLQSLPYVNAILPRLVDDARTLMTEHGVGVVAIMANDPADYPEDSFDNMVEVARQHDFPFPYLLDASQSRWLWRGVQLDFFGYNEAAGIAISRPFRQHWPAMPPPATIATNCWRQCSTLPLPAAARRNRRQHRLLDKVASRCLS